MKLNTRVAPDIDSLSRAALEQVLSDLRDAVKSRGRFAIALSGGHTPQKMYELWAQNEKYRTETPWDQVHLFWGDERFVGPDDPLSNYRMTREALISHVPIPPANVHAAPTTLSTPQAAAAAYDADLHKFFADAIPAGVPAFDVTLLGIGPEGHTASLFPDSPALNEKTKWVEAVTVAANPPNRLTFTLPVLNRSRNTYFLAAGEGKKEILDALRAETDPAHSQYPAARIQPTDGLLLWFLDEPASR
ncbi:MAG TPA: 6-phosphogluconolactonase [Candidatus Acidoferrales bacterium]